jgi:hypothetical protein
VNMRERGGGQRGSCVLRNAKLKLRNLHASHTLGKLKLRNLHA